ncbi:uncharacterized protein LOC114330203 isoform X2 [Diabrotica virgifera virgifera]|uniref:Activating molecule in BECN1-regulated autophagy protein 1 n=2 Tax=Diabrotica virgifera virgifera TaxID=50390 RepID=A0ABM5K0P3_DIAVI|nr:uncharacterized protein LOC114330203 isoform X2 [Diabrotica virgifera virgifera]
MNRDDYDLLQFKFKREPVNNAALDLLQGLENRSLGSVKKNVKSKEGIELFAEEEFVRKQEFSEMRCEMPGIPRSTFLMVFSPDGSKVASTHGNHNIYITDLRNGRNIKTLVGHPRTPWCIAFHPTSEQIVASGCLGGQVRIWDLSGGSEVWTAINHTVIASLAFHPNDRVLAIATGNCVHFWDWSKPDPFASRSTYTLKEKVRYVAFDSLGHKLITGIANGPLTRWEMVRAPVPVPRQDWNASPYRRRITQRLADRFANQNQPSSSDATTTTNPRDSLSYPERERRISMCYRTLVKEYEQLVHRYLQLYRSPTMIDRGTDPMEPDLWFNNSGTQTSESQASTSDTSQPSTSGTAQNRPRSGVFEPIASSSSRPSTSSATAGPIGRSSSGTSGYSSDGSPRPGSSGLVVVARPSRPITFATSASGPSTSGGTAETQSSKTPAERVLDETLPGSSGSTRHVDSVTEPSPSASQKSAHNLLTPSRMFSVIKKPSTLIRGTQTSESRKHKAEDANEPKEKRLKKSNGTKSKSSKKSSKDGKTNSAQTQTSTVRKEFPINDDRDGAVISNDRVSTGSLSEFRMRSQTDDVREAGPSGLNRQESTETEEEINSEPNPSTSTRESSRDANRTVTDELLSNIKRNAEAEVRNRILPIIRSLPAPDRPELIRLFENNREHVKKRFKQMYPQFLRKTGRRHFTCFGSSSESSSSEEETNNNQNHRLSYSQRLPSTDAPATNPSNSNSNSCNELERLVFLLTEIDDNGTERGAQTSRERDTRSNTTEGNGSTAAPNAPLDTAFVDDAAIPPSATVTLPGSSDLSEHSPAQDSPFRRFISSSDRSRWNDWQRVRPLLSSDFRRDLSGDNQRLESSFQPPATVANTNTRTTNSTIYTSNSSPRRRFFSHRISAFMPTRVNVIRYRRVPNYLLGRSRLGGRQLGSSTFGVDELFNYSELDNSEDDPPPPPPPPDADHPEPPIVSSSESSISDMYANIVRDLESTLDNVIRMRSSRPGETSSILTSFSDRLTSILAQSDTILRNITSSVDVLVSNTNRYPQPESSNTPWYSYDSNFYVRDQRLDLSPDANNSDTVNLFDIFSPRPNYNPVASDHTYPRMRNPDEHGNSESGSEMVTSIRMNIAHVQRQARILRQQVENIERIDRAMIEVEQLQVIRRLIVDLIRHLGNSSGSPGVASSRSSRSGVSSVRHMMAGTRISDSTPGESGADSRRPYRTFHSRIHGEGSGGSCRTEGLGSQRTDGGNPSGEGTSSGSNPLTNSVLRSGGRKTYPPSKMCRSTPSTSTTSNNTSPEPFSPSSSFNSRYQLSSNYSVINANTMGLMTRRLEILLTEEMAAFTTTNQPRQTPARDRESPSTIDLGEHILAHRLNGCILRMNRILGNPNSASLNLYRADPILAVTQDGVSRYGARHTLSLIIDSMSRHVEDLGDSRIPHGQQMHGVLAMSLLLTELMFLVVVDSIPPPTGRMPIRMHRLLRDGISLTPRFENLCRRMLATRQTSYLSQLTSCLRVMTVTMRQAEKILYQTYHARRSTLLPSNNTDRRMLLGSINRCLRTIRRQRQAENSSSQETPERNQESTADAASTSSTFNSMEWYSSISELISQISSENNDDDNPADTSQPSTSRASFESPSQANDVSSNNDNSDDDDDDTDGYGMGRSNLYRTSNINLSPSPGADQPATTSASVSPPITRYSRPWNVPLVAVNDVPVTETPTFAQRLISQRARFAERLSEMRSNPQIVGLLRPGFLHPLYSSVNPFDADLDDPREQIYDSDMITTVTPNHRIQAWDVSDWGIPTIASRTRNVVVSECKIHNDASVDIAKDGSILVTLLPSGGYLNVTNRLGVYSLKWNTLGQCLYTTSFEQNAVSVSLSPLSRHLVVGLASRIVPSDRWIMARVFKIQQKDEPGDRLPAIRELEQNRDSRINCIRWLPTSGQGFIYATNTGQLVVLT